MTASPHPKPRPPVRPVPSPNGPKRPTLVRLAGRIDRFVRLAFPLANAAVDDALTPPTLAELLREGMSIEDAVTYRQAVAWQPAPSADPVDVHAATAIALLEG